MFSYMVAELVETSLMTRARRVEAAATADEPTVVHHRWHTTAFHTARQGQSTAVVTLPDDSAETTSPGVLGAEVRCVLRQRGMRLYPAEKEE